MCSQKSDVNMLVPNGGTVVILKTKIEANFADTFIHNDMDPQRYVQSSLKVLISILNVVFSVLA